MTKTLNPASHPKLSWFIQAFSAVTCLILASCQSRVSTSLDKNTINLCRAKAIELGSNLEEVNRLHRGCIQDAKAGKSDIRESTDSIANIPPVQSAESRLDQYAYCVFNRERISGAYDRYTALSGRVPVFERQFGSNSTEALNAIREAHAAQEDLSNLIPESMRDGLTLIPEAAVKFSNCNRDAFGIQK